MLYLGSSKVHPMLLGTRSIGPQKGKKHRTIKKIWQDNLAWFMMKKRNARKRVEHNLQSS